MEFLRQTWTLVRLSALTIPQRWTNSGVVFIGVAGVITVLLGMLALSQSVTRTLAGSARPDRALVLSKGARFESHSGLSFETVALIKAAPGIRKTASGEPMASPEVLASVGLRDVETKSLVNVTVRGVTSMAFTLRPEIVRTSGRMINAGVRELLIGRAAQRRYGLEVGSKVNLRGVEWPIVGTFESQGSLHESELIGDELTLVSAFRRASINSMMVQLDSVEAVTALQRLFAADPRLQVEVVSEKDYSRRQSELFADLVRIVAYFAAAVMGAAAVFAVVSAIYAAVSARSVEIATLRAIGYSPFCVASAVLLEVVLLALLGGAVGVCAAFLAVVDNTFSAGSIVSQLEFDGDLMATGFGWSVMLGVFGGIPPAVHAALMPIPIALQES